MRVAVFVPYTLQLSQKPKQTFNEPDKSLRALLGLTCGYKCTVIKRVSELCSADDEPSYKNELLNLGSADPPMLMPVGDHVPSVLVGREYGSFTL